MGKNFKVDDTILRTWLLARVPSTNLSNNELMVSYLTTQLGGYRAGCMNDLLFYFLQLAGFSSYGSVGDMLNAYVCTRTGIPNVSDAYMAFFSSSTTSFSTTDGVDSFTKLYAKMDESAFVDSNSPAKALTAVGNAAISAGPSFFPGETRSGVFDGTGDRVTAADSADFFFDAAAFTVEKRLIFSSVAGTQTLISQEDGSVVWGVQFLGASTAIRLITNVFNVSWTWAPAINVKYHVAVIRGWGGNVNDWMITVNGTALGVAQTNAGIIPNSTSVLNIGGSSGVQLGGDFAGRMGHVRVSKGIARWTANFTPQDFPYS